MNELFAALNGNVVSTAIVLGGQAYVAVRFLIRIDDGVRQGLENDKRISAELAVVREALSAMGVEIARVKERVGHLEDQATENSVVQGQILAIQGQLTALAEAQHALANKIQSLEAIRDSRNGN